MSSCDDPFRKADELLSKITAKVIILDLHGEATSEKVALGWYLDGRITAVLGTHTHIPTADERILPDGTAYQTDVGMSGPYDSVIGVETELVLARFLPECPANSSPPRATQRCAPPSSPATEPLAVLTTSSASCSANSRNSHHILNAKKAARKGCLFCSTVNQLYLWAGW